jgi:serine/threonine protein kinase
VAEGVRALHDFGRLHRDIKPSNVLVTRDGRVTIVDFGLVADLAADNPERAVQIVGTPSYMAPEQAAMRPVSPASDWYSVGVLLFEALTGRLPFEGTSLEILALKQVDDARAGKILTDRGSERLCRGLLRLDPTLRPTAAQCSRALAGGPRPIGPSAIARRVPSAAPDSASISETSEALGAAGPTRSPSSFTAARAPARALLRPPYRDPRRGRRRSSSPAAATSGSRCPTRRLRQPDPTD